MELKMKPCPFCGNNAQIFEKRECIGHGDYITVVSVKCNKCASTGPIYDDYDYPKDSLKPLAVKAWNERYKEDQHGQTQST